MMRLTCLFSLIFITALHATRIQVNTTTQFLEDEFGRVRIFHGVNAVYKVPPWHPQTEGFDPEMTLSDIDAQNLYNWGFNFVRLGMMWPGAEPERGQFNSTYFATMKTIVNNLANYEIYTLLDAHQDVFNRKYCGEGAPDWAATSPWDTIPFPMPIGAPYKVDPTTGYPSSQDCGKRNFGEYYFADVVGNSFQQLYDNTNGLQDQFASFWAQVSQYFSNVDYVIGYELINEPWGGDIYLNPELLLPGVADKMNLAPMYSHLHSVIRQYDNDSIIFFERSLLDIYANSGFTSGPGGPGYNSKQLYSYHIYCAPINQEGDPTNIYECDFEDEYEYNMAMDDVVRLGCGGMMTEFGAMGNETIAMEALNFLTAAADKRLQSWAYWQFKLFLDLTTQGPSESFYSSDGKLEVNKVKTLSRTYAQAIAGIPKSMTFDPNTANFQLVFSVNTAIKQPTIIYLNEKYYYPNGYTVSVTPKGALSWSSPNTNYIQLINQPIKDGTLVVVNIAAK